MTALTIKNLRLTPYQQKDAIKAVWGDTLTLTFMIPHVAGESYVCGIDNERVVYPPSRPVCAYTNVFTRDGENVTFSLPLNTSKFRSYVSSIRKPMPVWLQVCRVGLDGKCETLVLDDILAIPSVLDATNTVCPGDPLKQLLENKMDKPAAAGTEGQVLTMDADGHYAWADLPHIPEDPVQSDWDESDSSNLAYIRNKPAISKVGHTGEYNDLLGKPHIPVDPVQADYEQSDSEALDYIKHKPDLSVYSLVTETGNSIAMSIDDNYDLVVTLLDKNGNTLSTQDVDLPIESMIVDATYANGVLTLTLQNGNTVDVDISDIVSGLVPDSRKVNGHALDADVTISYNDLTDKPVIPEQVQSDWDESDSQAVDFIKGKPVLAAVATTGSYNSLSNRPAIPNFTGGWFGIWHDQADSAATTVTLSVSGTSPRANTFQYCTNINTNNWTDYTLGTALTLTQYQYVLWRNKDSAKLLGNATGHYVFSITGGGVYLSGNIMSLKDKGMQYNDFCAAYDFYEMFKDCTAIKDASMLELPASVANSYSFYGMFNGCTGMVRGPAILPATVLGAQCYRFAFQNCTSLVKAPALPATTLASMCYHYMFGGCTSLTEAPDLPAATVPSLAYNFMFNGCTALRHVKVGATALGTDYTQSWLYGVAATGVIECPASLDLSTRGADTAPAGWTIVRTDAPWSDWDESDSTEASYILNKPAIPSGGGGDSTDYLCFTAGQANSTVRIDKVGSAPAITLEYSTDRQTWTNYTWTSSTGETITLAAAGDRVWIRGDNPNGLGTTNHNNYHQFKMTGKIYASGNITSLIDKTCARMDVPAYCYQYLFQSCTSLLTPPKLTAMELATHCYGNMFNGSGIIIPPELPAMNVPYEAYSGMFGTCTALTTSPELPATTVGQKAYYYMFHRCSTIRIGPSVLPAKTLSAECYRSMFDICANFVKAPYIMATDASASWCFYNMFYNCPNLHYVRIEATSLTQAIGWFSSAAANGVFECPSALSITTRGASTVPAGWTIIRSDAPWSDFAQTDATEGAYVKNRGISATSASSDATYTVAAGSSSTGVLTVASALTLSAGTVANTSIAYAEVVIDLSEGATVTAGTNITFKDEPVDGCRNICVVRWQDGSATLYVVDTIELS